MFLSTIPPSFSPCPSEVVLDSNGSGEAAGQQRASPSASGAGKAGGREGGEEEEWRLKEELMGALDVGGKRGDLRGIRVLKNDRVMGARPGGPCLGNCEDDEGAEWVGVYLFVLCLIIRRPPRSTLSPYPTLFRSVLLLTSAPQPGVSSLVVACAQSKMPDFPSD